jgi:hypothetical protein
MTMTTDAITTPATPLVDRTSTVSEEHGHELVDLHCRAGGLVAGLADSPAWSDADRIVTRLTVEAEAVARLTAPGLPEAAPAVVRCRELAAAQRRMVRAIEGDDRFDVCEAALVRTRALVAELAELAGGPRATLGR